MRKPKPIPPAERQAAALERFASVMEATWAEQRREAEERMAADRKYREESAAESKRRPFADMPSLSDIAATVYDSWTPHFPRGYGPFMNAYMPENTVGYWVDAEHRECVVGLDVCHHPGGQNIARRELSPRDFPLHLDSVGDLAVRFRFEGEGSVLWIRSTTRYRP